jgi:MFS family permease
MKFNHLSSNWKIFYLIWGGQAISLIGTAMSRFALMIWAYQQTKAATTLALLGFFNYGAYVLCSPLAGIVIDRRSRKIIMLLADLGAAVMTAIIFILFTRGELQIWHLFILEAISGACESFQNPAYHASITLLLPREDYSRASGLNGLSDSMAQVIAPALAGVLLPLVGLRAVLLIDLFTFLLAFTTLLPAALPQLNRSGSSAPQKKNWSAQLGVGMEFLGKRPGLIGLLLVFAAINLFAGLTYYSILSPMILARSGQNPSALGWVQSALGLGGVAGGILVSIWGGPKNRARGLLICAVSFLLGDGMFAFGRTLPAWILAGFMSNFFIPLFLAPIQAMWQSKTPPEIQGRVFALKGMIQPATIPLGYLMAGPLADKVFEPGMSVAGALASAFGWITGTGPGAGMGLMFACTALGGTLVCLIGYAVPVVRHLERDLPDVN